MKSPLGHAGDGSTAEGTPGKLMTGAEIFARSLVAEKVEVLFGYPGGATIGVYDALHDISDIKHVLTRHEQGATHAAEGYAKATGKPGVVLVTSGPGATNTVTGIADAYMDSIPIVVFTGQVSLPLIGNDAFQEADIVGITRPVTKHSYLVRRVDELAGIIKEAFYIAQSGRPGPVLIDLPKDVMAQKAHFAYPDSVQMRSYKPVVDGNMRQIKKAAELIAAARRPVLYVGGGTILSNASEELMALAEKLHCPVTTTLHGLGAFPERHHLALGMLGMHGTWYANAAVNYCDLLLAVGARLLQEVGTIDTKDWLTMIAAWKEEHPLRYENGEEIRAQYVIQKLGELTGGNAVVVTDVGQHQMWCAQFLNYSTPRSHITSGGLGTMGFSLPAAMGAAFGRSDVPVISISGDGGFQMNLQEMATIVEHRLPIKVFVINNGFLGMVRQWQELFWRKRYSQVALANPDFVALARAFGCPAAKAERTAEVEEVIRTALAHKDGPYFVEFVVAKEDNVYPMIPAGQSFHEMIDTPDPVDGNGSGKDIAVLAKGVSPESPKKERVPGRIKINE